MKLADNPFFVLGVSPDASRMEIEREAQKLLGMLELRFEAAQTYQTPVGPQVRTQEMVRAAAAALREPYQRLVAELWARHAPPPSPSPSPSESSSASAIAHVTRRKLGWS